MQPFDLQTFKLGLIGYPVSHSLSPKIQNAALAACGLEGDYSLFPIHPDDKQGLHDILTRVRYAEITGLNVTIPHKQNVIPLLDGLTPTAQAIGAVNVIYVREDKLIGDNTDAAGFLSDLQKFLKGKGMGVKKKSTLILGAGGSARSVVYALLRHGWQVTVAARRIEQAQGLARQFAGTKVIQWNVQTFKRLNMQLLVNTTPLGMTPNVDQSPLPEKMDLPNYISIYDLVYNPRETKLVRDARAQGLQARTGLGMLIEQAALGFELWTGHKPPLDVLWKAVES